MIWENQSSTPSQAAATIGEKIKQHRLAKNISQMEMAKLTGVSPSTLKRIESQGLGSLRDVMAIAIELEIDGDIIAGIPRPPLRSLSDLDDEGHRITRKRAGPPRRAS
jgi:transcriptional regulator with XRE-family HTH domain